MNLLGSRQRMWHAVAILGAMNVLVIFGAFLGNGPLRGRGWVASELALQLNCLGENRASVWYSGMLLLCASLAMAACYWLEAQRSHERGSRLARFGWLGCAAAFALLSLDEMGSLHERFPTGILPSFESLGGWTAHLILPILAGAAFFGAFAWYRLRHQPAAALLMGLGIVLFLSVPLQEHIEVLHFYGDDAPTRPLWMPLLEEGTELFGTLAFLAAALLSIAHMSSTPAPPRDIRKPMRQVPGMPVALTIVAILGVGMIVSLQVLPTYMNLDDARGIPANWFPSAAAFIIALVLVFQARFARHGGFSKLARAMLALGLLHVVLSADHGSAHHLSETILESNQVRRRQMDALLLLWVLSAGTWAIISIPDVVTRAAVLAWTSLQALAFLPALPERPVIAMVAYAILLPALARFAHLPATPAARPEASASLVSDHVATQGRGFGHAPYAEHEGSGS